MQYFTKYFIVLTELLIVSYIIFYRTFIELYRTFRYFTEHLGTLPNIYGTLLNI